MKKLKVAMVHPAVGSSNGGSQSFVLELSRYLKEKCDIEILAYNTENDLCKKIKCIPRFVALNSTEIHINLLNKFLKNFFNKPELIIEHLSALFPTIIHLLLHKYDVLFPSNDWGGLLACSIVRKIKGTPIVFTEHSSLMNNGKIAKRNLKFKPDKYVTLSTFMKNWVDEKYTDINTEYIPNGVNFEKFNPYINGVKLPLDGPIVLASARYQTNKRLELAVDAMEKIGYGSLLVLSSGEGVEDFEQYGLSKLGKKRFKLMSVPYGEIQNYYKSCDVFTLPSEFEPFGLVYLEAMACNKPIVATDDESRREIIGDAGVFCNPENVEEYAEAIKTALKTTFKNKPFEQAKRFDWKLISEKYSAVFLDVNCNN